MKIEIDLRVLSVYAIGFIIFEIFYIGCIYYIGELDSARLEKELLTFLIIILIFLIVLFILKILEFYFPRIDWSFLFTLGGFVLFVLLIASGVRYYLFLKGAIYIIFNYLHIYNVDRYLSDVISWILGCVAGGIAYDIMKKYFTILKIKLY